MLQEIISGKHSKDRSRRWFTDDYFDLIVWFGQDSSISGFQLCYDLQRIERAITWSHKKGYSHERVDDGESNPTKSQTPILVPDGAFPFQDVLERFLASSEKIDPSIRSFVAEKLRDYSGSVKA